MSTRVEILTLLIRLIDIHQDLCLLFAVYFLLCFRLIVSSDNYFNSYLRNEQKHIFTKRLLNIYDFFMKVIFIKLWKSFFCMDKISSLGMGGYDCVVLRCLRLVAMKKSLTVK